MSTRRPKRSEQPDTALVELLERGPRINLDPTKRHEVTVVNGVVRVRELGPIEDEPAN